MSGRGWDTAVSIAAWKDLVASYQEMDGENASDFDLAELLRQRMSEVEGL